MASAKFFSTLNSIPLTFLAPGPLFSKAITGNAIDHKGIELLNCNRPVIDDINMIIPDKTITNIPADIGLIG